MQPVSRRFWGSSGLAQELLLVGEMIAQRAEKAGGGDAAVGVFGGAEIHAKLCGVHDAGGAEGIEMSEQSVSDLMGGEFLEGEAVSEATDEQAEL